MKTKDDLSEKEIRFRSKLSKEQDNEFMILIDALIKYLDKKMIK